MRTIGKNIFAKDSVGRLESRIGTLFLRTPALVTVKGVHMTQRLLWIETLNSERAAKGLGPLSPEEEEAELTESADLIFTEEHVLIRPDPDRMDLALRADEELQKIVSKRKIRFLNTHSSKVRNALRARGENWRIARSPITQEDMADLIEKSRVALSGEPIYYYNSATGTRYVTCAAAESLASMPVAELRRQLKEAQAMLSRRNRMGRPELDLFPPTTPPDVKNAMKTLDVDSLDDGALVASLRRIDAAWRMSLPPELRDETAENFEWRNEMCRTLTQSPNDTGADEDELVQGISPEFYRQIEWLPGARVEDGEIIFDPIWEEYDRTRDPELGAICDQRARNLIFNLSRFFGSIDYVNIGRIAHSLARAPIAGSRRGNVYVVQFKEVGKPMSHVYMLRFQKWGVAERLDEGKDLLRAILESNDYTDYILDRRLMCVQLGMNLPPHVGAGVITEPYRGSNQYNGTTVTAAYFARSYIHGTASDKIPPQKFKNPLFAAKFASLMGEAAAIDMVVGRRSTETKENLFDKNYEVIQCSSDGLPARLVVTDHGGSFVNYLHSFEEIVPPYANVVRRRASFVADPKAFAAAYVEAFEKALAAVQKRYRSRRKAFDMLFVGRPFDVAGSGAYRWAKTLERLDKCDPAAVAKVLASAIAL